MPEKLSYEQRLIYFRSVLEKLSAITEKIEAGAIPKKEVQTLALVYAQTSREWFSPDFDDIREGRGGERLGDPVDFSQEEFTRFDLALTQIKEAGDWSLLYAILIGRATLIETVWGHEPSALKVAQNIRKFAATLAKAVGLS